MINWIHGKLCNQFHSPETLFATQTQTVGVHQVAKVFPASGHFEAFLVQFGGNEIYGRCGWHTSGESSHAVALEVRNRFQIVGNHSQRIARGDEEGFAADDHVAIAVSIECCSQIVITVPNGVDEVFGVREIWVRVQTTEIFQWSCVHYVIGRGAQAVQEDFVHIWTSHWNEKMKRLIDVKLHSLARSLPPFNESILNFNGVPVFWPVTNARNFSKSKISFIKRT